MDLTINNFKPLQLGEFLARIGPLKDLYRDVELKDELKAQEKLCENFRKALKEDLNLEQISSLYSGSIILFLLADPILLNEHLELLNDCFNYSDMLKPTMLDYATRKLLHNFKFAASLNIKHENYDYMLYLLSAIPHIVTASETGKMISLGLLRAFLTELTGSDKASPIVMHIYRNISEIWHMVKTVNITTILDEWSSLKLYTFVKSFALILSTAVLCTNNTALKQAGYRGFELPQSDVELAIAEWFKTLRNKLAEKHKIDKCKTGLLLVRYIDFNILSFLTEVPNEIGSETGIDAIASEAGTDAVASEAGTDAIASEAGTDAVSCQTGTDATASEAGTDSVACETGTEALSLDRNETAVA